MRIRTSWRISARAIVETDPPPPRRISARAIVETDPPPPTPTIGEVTQSAGRWRVLLAAAAFLGLVAMHGMSSNHVLADPMVTPAASTMGVPHTMEVVSDTSSDAGGSPRTISSPSHAEMAHSECVAARWGEAHAVAAASTTPFGHLDINVASTGGH